MPSSATRRRVAAERAVAMIERAASCARAARAIEEPIRPMPISARRLKSGVFMGCALAGPCGPSRLPHPGRRQADAARATGWESPSRLLPHELRERGDREPVRLLRADAHAQGVRQFVGFDATQDQAAAYQES